LTNQIFIVTNRTTLEAQLEVANSITLILSFVNIHKIDNYRLSLNKTLRLIYLFFALKDSCLGVDPFGAIKRTSIKRASFPILEFTLSRIVSAHLSKT
jgi:hypothetical protein